MAVESMEIFRRHRTMIMHGCRRARSPDMAIKTPARDDLERQNYQRRNGYLLNMPRPRFPARLYLLRFI